MAAPTIRLTRELRFGLHSSEVPAISGQANGFAGNPPLLDVAPFLVLAATLSGEVDAKTGMLVNIKVVDRVLRQMAVPLLREGHYVKRLSAAGMVLRLMEILPGELLPHRLEAIRLGLSPYLSVSILAKEPTMVSVSQRFEFSAAHRLHAEALSAAGNVEVFGRCNNPHGHGHNYELEVTIAGPIDPSTGQVIPVVQLQKIVNERIIEVFDHKHLNLDCPDFRALNPTVENISRVVYERLKPGIAAPARLASVRVWETPKTMCEYGE